MWSSDVILKDKGHIVIHDFYNEFSYSRVYHHDPRLKSYKMDYSRLWLGNPLYKRVRHRIYDHGPPPKKDEEGPEVMLSLYNDNRVIVDVLQKDRDSAFPLVEDKT